MGASTIPTARTRRIAFYGGSFDPPHRAHLAVAEAARKALALDEVLFAPVGAQPLKGDGASASFEDRVAMTRLAIAGKEGFRLSLADAPRSDGRANYSYDTLERLKAGLGDGSELYCLIGADSLRNLRYWHRADEIPFLAHLIVAARPEEDLSDLARLLPEGIACSAAAASRTNGVTVRRFELRREEDAAPLFLLPELNFDLSATRVREHLREGVAAQPEELSWEVFNYLRAHGLYLRFTGRDATR